MSAQAKQVPSTYGLKTTVIDKIITELENFPDIEKAILYGSRAKGNYHNGSDIDLTLAGAKLATSTLYRLDRALEELLLPYTIDLSLMKEIENPKLLDHIQRVGKTFYQRDTTRAQ